MNKDLKFYYDLINANKYMLENFTTYANSFLNIRDKA